MIPFYGCTRCKKISHALRTTYSCRGRDKQAPEEGCTKGDKAHGVMVDELHRASDGKDGNNRYSRFRKLCELIRKLDLITICHLHNMCKNFVVAYMYEIFIVI